MRQTAIAIMLLGINVHAFAQDNEIPVNMLTAPSSSVFNLMGIESSDVVRPKDPTDLYVSVRNSTEGFGTLPKNYAVEFSPYWVFFKDNDASSSFFAPKGSSVKNTFLQTLVISAATRIDDKIDVSNYSQVGAGIKFSLLRGDVSDEFTAQIGVLTSKMANLNSEVNNILAQLKQSDPVYKGLEQKRRDAAIAQNTALLDSINEAISEWENLTKDKLKGDTKLLTADIRKHISKLDMKRVGWVSEFNAAAVWEFPENTADYSRLSKLGVWFTAGYTPKKAAGLDFLAMIRYIYSRNEVGFFTVTDSTMFSNHVSFLDLGAKLNYSASNGKISVGAEGVARIASMDSPPYWKYGLNVNYQVLPNKVLSFTVGQDYTMDNSAFDSPVSLSPSNLILALNLVLGFGNERPIN